MDFQQKTRTCEKCKAQVPLNKVKLYPKDKDRNLLLCEACVEALKNAAQSKIPSAFAKTPVKNVAPSIFPEPKVKNLPKSVEMKSSAIGIKGSAVHNAPKPREMESAAAPKEPVKNQYQPKKEEHKAGLKSMYCSRCKYNFKIDPGKAGVSYRMVCPYCGQADRLGER